MSRAARVTAAWACTMLLGVAALVLMAVSWRDGSSFTPHSLVSLGFGSVGALILRRRPHRIGMLFLGFGAFAAFVGFMFQVCPMADPTTGSTLAALCGDESRLGAMLWPASYLFFGSLFLFFPTGHLPSRRWLPMASLFIGSWGALALGNLVAGDVWMEERVGFLPALAVWSLALVALSPLFRIRRAGAIERQQLRLLGYVIGFTLLLIGVGIPLDLAGQQAILNVLNFFILASAAVGVPAAITLAILRYRLYEIDVIVNKTLVYVLVTATIAGVYLGSVVVLQRLLEPLTADSDLAVAGSTLAVAALFRPLRARVQTFVDHRFYRRKYDAQATLATFASRLRDEVDLVSLSDDLVVTVGTAMQPAHVSLWLRPSAEQAS